MGDVLDRVTMQIFVRGYCTMIAAPVQCDVDGIPQGARHVRVPIAMGPPNESRTSCGLRRPQTRQTDTFTSGRRGAPASCAGETAGALSGESRGKAHYSRGAPVITNGPVSTHWSVLSAFSRRSRIWSDEDGPKPVTKPTGTVQIRESRPAGALVSKKPLSLPPITAPILIRLPGTDTQRTVYVRPSTSVSPAVGLRKAKVPCETACRSWPLLHARARSRRGQETNRECMGAGLVKECQWAV